MKQTTTKNNSKLVRVKETRPRTRPNEECLFACDVHKRGGAGQHPRKARRGQVPVKFFDCNLTTVSPLTTGTITGLLGPAQGAAVNQRIGDIIYLQKMWINYTCDAANADVYSSLRVIVFQWHPNNGLIVPTASDILQLVSTSVYAMYDWNFADQYTILYDKLHSFAGLSTAPTASSNQCFGGQIDLSRASKQCNFSIGSTFSSNSIYLLAISDSAIIPTPNLTFVSRITFEEEK